MECGCETPFAAKASETRQHFFHVSDVPVFIGYVNKLQAFFRKSLPETADHADKTDEFKDWASDAGQRIFLPVTTLLQFLSPETGESCGVRDPRFAPLRKAPRWNALSSTRWRCGFAA
jgi:hypothetical protein